MICQAFYYQILVYRNIQRMQNYDIQKINKSTIIISILSNYQFFFVSCHFQNCSHFLVGRWTQLKTQKSPRCRIRVWQDVLGSAKIPVEFTSRSKEMKEVPCSHLEHFLGLITYLQVAVKKYSAKTLAILLHFLKHWC